MGRLSARTKLDMYINTVLCIMWISDVHQMMIFTFEKLYILMSRITDVDFYSTSLISWWHSRFCHRAMLFSTTKMFSEVTFYHKNNRNVRLKLPYITTSKMPMQFTFFCCHQTLECFGYNLLKSSHSYKN